MANNKVQIERIERMNGSFRITLIDYKPVSTNIVAIGDLLWALKDTARIKQ